MLQFQKYPSNPVITKGQTYGGIVANALAAPSVVWDGTRYVMTCSIWQASSSKWYSIFFTSPNLTNWTYISGSLIAPNVLAGTTDYIFGNAGLAFWNGFYWLAAAHYPTGATPQRFGLWKTSDPTFQVASWIKVADPLLTEGPPYSFDQYDPTLVVNPYNNMLETWFGAINTSGGSMVGVAMADSPDGTTWTNEGLFLPVATPFTYYGAANILYTNNSRYISFDAVESETGGARGTAMEVSNTLDTNWTTYGSIIGANPANPAESVQVFDFCFVGAVDRNDGKGPLIYALYAMSDNLSGGDATDSSIGLASLVPPYPLSTQVATGNLIQPDANGKTIGTAAVGGKLRGRSF